MSRVGRVGRSRQYGGHLEVALERAELVHHRTHGVAAEHFLNASRTGVKSSALLVVFSNTQSVVSTTVVSNKQVVCSE